MNSPPTSRSSGFTHTIKLNPRSHGYGLKKHKQKAGPLQPQHVNTIHIPKAMLTAPFLQYSALTPGQKSYLCSVCEAHSEDHMRKLMQQHYLNVLHRSIRTGIILTSDTTFTTNSHLGTSTPEPDHSPTQTRKRSDGKTKQKPKSTSKKTTALPKITSHGKKFPSRSPESNMRKSRPSMKKTNHGLLSPRGRGQRESDKEWAIAEDNSLLSDINPLSLGKEDFISIT